ncbi:MAG: recombinase family protein [Archaeoglobaceae archaeon]
MRTSTEEQNPEGQLKIIEEYAEEKGYKIVKVFEDQVSGKVPLEMC